MKKLIVSFIILTGVAANAEAQTLKELLYSGKLRKDSNTVIRKTDDLSTKIDTATKKQAEPEVAKVAPTASDSATKRNSAVADATTDSAEPKNAEPGADSGATTDNTPAASPATVAKNNNQLWKGYIDSLASTLKSEVLSSKKVKKETYYLYVEYEIGTDGQVSIINVVSTPENDFLQQQIKDRMNLSAPKLNPVLDSSGKPRKVKRKYNFNITKE